jgi:signal transduction histidine kinase/FixJ family two-component response regulator
MGEEEGTGALAAAAVKAEQIRTIHRQNPWVIAFSPLDAAIVGAFLWSSVPRALIVGWVLATALVTLVRTLVRRRYLADPAPNVDRWARRFVIGAAVQGLLWGVGSVVLLGHRLSGGTQLILVFVVAGIAAGGAGTLATYLPACIPFTLLALVPLALRFLVAGDAMHVTMGVLCGLYAVALLAVAVNTNRALSDAFRLRFDKDALLARLSRAQASLEEANRALERRVEERSQDLKRQDEALQEARRLESIGLLAGGVAHDFNNLLTVILGNAAILQDDLALGRGGEGPLDEIRGAAERAASLVSQLLASSRRQPREVRVLDLNLVLSDTHRLLSRLIGEHIELDVALARDALPVAADRGQLEQVIVNLATNARDAMPGGGRLSLTTALVDVTAEGSPFAPGLPPGTYAMLSARDTGVGMDAETTRLAFHPFFTTKEVGRGTGLGLATVNGIVEQSGGRVFVESSPGQGSAFRVFLPRTDAPATAEAPAAPEMTASRRATALLAEDEPLVRGVISRALLGAGFTVLEASNGEEALALSASYAGTIDLLVTDVVMARLGGPALAKELTAKRPEIAVLFISGYSATAELPAPGTVENVDYLPKPFTASALLAHVWRLLGKAAHTAGVSELSATVHDVDDAIIR